MKPHYHIELHIRLTRLKLAVNMHKDEDHELTAAPVKRM